MKFEERIEELLHEDKFKGVDVKHGSPGYLMSGEIEKFTKTGVRLKEGDEYSMSKKEIQEFKTTGIWIGKLNNAPATVLINDPELFPEAFNRITNM